MKITEKFLGFEVLLLQFCEALYFSKKKTKKLTFFSHQTAVCLIWVKNTFLPSPEIFHALTCRSY